MMYRLLLVPAIVALMGQHMVVAVTTNQTLWLQSIMGSLSVSCPGDNVCHNKSEAELDAEYDRYSRQHLTPCCTACSCKETCGQIENCCFQIGSVSSNSGRNREECMNLQSRIHFLDGPKVRRYYNVVVSCDPRLDFSGHHLDEPAPWGALYPVYSKSTKDIYENMSIALCNGVVDAVEWNTIINCKRDVTDELSSDDFANIFVRNTFGAVCTAIFTYPENDYSDLRLKECFPELYNICNPDFPVPEGVLMSKEEIRSACAGDFVSPFRGMRRFYKNVFCSICKEGSEFPSICHLGNPLDGHDSKDTRSRFGLLLSGDFLGSLKKEPSSFRTACRSSFDDNQIGVKADCRRILCPVGQFELPDGSCSYVAKNMKIDAINICIRLTPDIPSDLERLKQISVSTLNVAVIDEPWSADNWLLAHYFCRYTFKQTDYCFFDTFILMLQIGQITVESTSFYSSIEKALTKKVTWQLGNIKMEFRQTFQRTFSPAMILNTPLYNVSTDDGFLIRNDVNPLEMDSNDYITKLYFCSLVELTVDDYDLRNDTVVYKRTNRFYFEGEIIFPGSDLNRKPKVCLSDTDFTEIDVSNAIEIVFNFSLLSFITIPIMCAYQ